MFKKIIETLKTLTLTQVILILLIILIVENTILIFNEKSIKSLVLTNYDIINKTHLIKNDHIGIMNETCDILVKRYERRAMSIAYRNLSSKNFHGLSIKDINDIPEENIIYIKLSDDLVMPLAYFDEKGFLQSLILPANEDVIIDKKELEKK